MAGPARAAFFGLIETPDAERTQAYQDWHADDHQPENWALPGVVYANRWIAQADHCAVRFSADERLAQAQFLITYFFSEPIAESLATWNGLARELAPQGRMFQERVLHLGSVFECSGGEVASDAVHSTAALPHRRHRGVFLRLGRSSVPAPDDDARFASVVARPGVNGGLRFANSNGPEYGPSRAGSAELYFSSGDPLDVFAGVDVGTDAVFASSFRTTADWLG
ncbi:hypothetical protein MK489_24215 [Myxococcota bacterium]|nr:hypothetical protein [Myxococcota bacterium]